MARTTLTAKEIRLKSGGEMTLSAIKADAEAICDAEARLRSI